MWCKWRGTMCRSVDPDTGCCGLRECWRDAGEDPDDDRTEYDPITAEDLIDFTKTFFTPIKKEG